MENASVRRELGSDGIAGLAYHSDTLGEKVRRELAAKVGPPLPHLGGRMGPLPWRIWGWQSKRRRKSSWTDGGAGLSTLA